MDEYDRQTRVESQQEGRTAVILTGMGAETLTASKSRLEENGILARVQ
jgi:hypothetical protein